MPGMGGMPGMPGMGGMPGGMPGMSNVPGMGRMGGMNPMGGMAPQGIPDYSYPGMTDRNNLFNPYFVGSHAQNLTSPSIYDQVQVYGLTGLIKFDAEGFRSDFEVEITEMDSKEGMHKVSFPLFPSFFLSLSFCVVFICIISFFIYLPVVGLFGTGQFGLTPMY